MVTRVQILDEAFLFHIVLEKDMNPTIIFSSGQIVEQIGLFNLSVATCLEKEKFRIQIC